MASKYTAPPSLLTTSRHLIEQLELFEESLELRKRQTVRHVLNDFAVIKQAILDVKGSQDQVLIFRKDLNLSQSLLTSSQKDFWLRTLRRPATASWLRSLTMLLVSPISSTCRNKSSSDHGTQPFHSPSRQHEIIYRGSTVLHRSPQSSVKRHVSLSGQRDSKPDTKESNTF